MGEFLAHQVVAVVAGVDEVSIQPSRGLEHVAAFD